LTASRYRRRKQDDQIPFVTYYVTNGLWIGLSQGADCAAAMPQPGPPASRTDITRREKIIVHKRP